MIRYRVIIAAVALLALPRAEAASFDTPLYGRLTSPWIETLAAMIQVPDFKAQLTQALPRSARPFASAPTADFWALAVSNLPKEYDEKKLRDSPEAQQIFLAALKSGFAQVHQQVQNAVVNLASANPESIPGIVENLRALQRYAVADYDRAAIPATIESAKRLYLRKTGKVLMVDAARTAEELGWPAEVPITMISVGTPAKIARTVLKRPTHADPGYRQAISKWQAVREKLSQDPELAPLLVDRVVRIMPGDRVYSGGFSMVMIPAAETGLFYKMSGQSLHLDEPTASDDDNRASGDEARTLVRLNALNVKNAPKIIAIGVNHDGAIWMELQGIPGGESLASDLWRSMSPVRKIDAVIRLGRSFQGLHKAGWVHKDIKPRNQLVTKSGKVGMIDFSVASEAGNVFDGATPQFASAEAEQGGPGYEDSDVFSFAKSLDVAMTKHGGIRQTDMDKSGLTELITGATANPRKDRRPNNMKEMIARLRQVRQYFKKHPGRARRPVSTAYAGYFIGQIKETYKFPLEEKARLESLALLARKIQGRFNYVRIDKLKSILSALEGGARRDASGDVAYVNIEAAILGDAVVVRSLGERRPRPEDPSVIEASSHLYHGNVVTGKRPSVSWSIIRRGRESATLAELRIPILSAAELAQFDADLAREEHRRIAADLQRWQTFQDLQPAGVPAQ